MQGGLFTQDFLQEGIRATADWIGLDDAAVLAFRVEMQRVFAGFPVGAGPNEAVTERNLIDHILRALGWEQLLPQQAAGRHRSEVPDYLLFADADSLARAGEEKEDTRRYRHGLAILEAKRWQRPLDRGREPDLFDDGVPSTQMLRYMTRAEVASEKRIQWGVLTNGRHWRLYFQGARSRSEEFLEIDLPIVAKVAGVDRNLFSPLPDQCDHQLRVFMLMFRREAFLARQEGERTFHGLALEEGRLWEARVAASLSEVVFQRVFPGLVAALAKHDRQAPQPLTADYLEEVRQAALTLLYRILFILYAEDRELLPVRDPAYDDYSLRRIRRSIHDRIDRNDYLSRKQSRYYVQLKQLFSSLHDGDDSVGLPPYNGNLFDPTAHPLLARVDLPDVAFAPLFDALSRRLEGGQRKWINFRDLSVQQLGTIYERLLEHVAVVEDGAVVVRPTVFARKTSGSFYTHQDLVDLIIRRAVGPLLDERRQAFRDRLAALRASRRPKGERLAELAAADPAAAFLRLRVCDPAMGSGHFLVSLVDYLADAVLEAIGDAELSVDWADPDQPYRSPVTARIDAIRQHIMALAKAGHWIVDEDQLDDRQLVRRMILKRVIYGVDKNAMAVELAKVALWLHTFTVGAPLSFLDHHLRHGDSLFGEWVGPVMRELAQRYTLLINPYVVQARQSVGSMQRIEEMTDSDIAEVRASSDAFAGITEATAPLRRFLDFRQALRWLGHHEFGGTLPQELADLLDGYFGDPFRIVAGEIVLDDGQGGEADDPDMFANGSRRSLAVQQREERRKRAAAAELLARARAIAERERFFHWEIGFPGVWDNWESAAPTGGFDAVIGNPPWDRMKLQEVEWFAMRAPEIAHAARASDRKRMIAALAKDKAPLWQDYETARARAEAATEVVRRCGQYPLLSAGDVNIYSLFVERGHRLVEPAGMVGLLCPSGIASDLGASVFFRQISTGGRLAALFDFENRKVFFPDVDSRFKFCTYVAGGSNRRFDHADCAFFLHATSEMVAADRLFRLSADDFARVNPNTGTAPVFRQRRDAEITTGIYRSHPVLVRHSADGPQSVWPVRYLRMFDMTNDASLFRTRTELEKDGFYPLDPNRLKRGKDESVPLYEGKMVQAYDHRAASVVVNAGNLHRPAQPEPSSASQHADPAWCAEPQFWVSRTEVDKMIERQPPSGAGRKASAVRTAPHWYLGFKDVTSPTNVRTMIASIVPGVAVGNTLALLLPECPDPPKSDDEWQDYAGAVRAALKEYSRYAPLVLANLNAIPYDYMARQKVHGQHLNYFVVEQIPVIEARGFSAKVGRSTLAEFVRGEALRLSYTASDLAAFADDLGYTGPPFPWDEDDRRHRRARLDAIFFHLYGIGREDAEYILDTFPIVRRQDEAAFGRYRTKELVLAYMNAVAAGDFDTVVTG